MLVGRGVQCSRLTVWMCGRAEMKEEIALGLARGAAGGALGGGVRLRDGGARGFRDGRVPRRGRVQLERSPALAGALVGLALAATFGVLFARGALKVPLKRSSRSPRRALLWRSSSWWAAARALEGNVLPASRTEMRSWGRSSRTSCCVHAHARARRGLDADRAGRRSSGRPPLRDPGGGRRSPLPPCRGASRPRAASRGSRAAVARCARRARRRPPRGPSHRARASRRPSRHEARTRGRRGGVRVRAPGRRPHALLRGAARRGGGRCGADVGALLRHSRGGRGAHEPGRVRDLRPIGYFHEGARRCAGTALPIALAPSAAGGLQSHPGGVEIRGLARGVSLAELERRRRSRGGR